MFLSTFSLMDPICANLLYNFRVYFWYKNFFMKPKNLFINSWYFRDKGPIVTTLYAWEFCGLLLCFCCTIVSIMHDLYHIVGMYFWFQKSFMKMRNVFVNLGSDSAISASVSMLYHLLFLGWFLLYFAYVYWFPCHKRFFFKFSVFPSHKKCGKAWSVLYIEIRT